MSKQIDIYLDQISIFSLSKILIKLKISEINRVYYIDKTFTLGLEFFFRKIQFIDCNKFEESRIKIENKYLHLYLWQSLTDLSNKFLSPIFISAFGVFKVSGLIRLPKPAAKIIAYLIFIFFEIKYFFSSIYLNYKRLDFSFFFQLISKYKVNTLDSEVYYHVYVVLQKYLVF